LKGFSSQSISILLINQSIREEFVNAFGSTKTLVDQTNFIDFCSTIMDLKLMKAEIEKIQVLHQNS